MAKAGARLAVRVMREPLTADVSGLLSKAILLVVVLLLLLRDIYAGGRTVDIEAYGGMTVNGVA